MLQTSHFILVSIYSRTAETTFFEEAGTITKRMVDEMDAKIAKDREEILKVAKEAGVPYEKVVAMENGAMQDLAQTMVAWDKVGVFDKENREHGEI